MLWESYVNRRTFKETFVMDNFTEILTLQSKIGTYLPFPMQAFEGPPHCAVIYEKR
eukprot:c31875_g1_i1 orf=79-246(-)